MKPIHIGPLEIIDHNNNDRYDAGEANLRVLGKSAKIREPGAKFFIDAAGINFAKFQSNPLSRTSLFVSLLKDVDKHWDGNFRLLVREAERLGVDPSKITDGLVGRYGDAMANLRHAAKAGDVPATKTYAKRATRLAENLRDFNIKMDDHDAEVDRLFKSAVTIDIANTLSMLESFAFVQPHWGWNRQELGNTAESKAAFFRANLRKIEHYANMVDVPVDWNRLDALQKYLYVHILATGKSSWADDAKKILEDYFFLNNAIRNSHHGIDLEKTYSDVRAIEYWMAMFYGIELTAIPGEKAIFNKHQEERYVSLEKRAHFGLPGLEIQKELAELEESATQHGLPYDESRGEQILEIARHFHLNLAFQLAECSALSEDVELARKELDNAWELASELNVDFDSAREADILRKSMGTENLASDYCDDNLVDGRRHYIQKGSDEHRAIRRLIGSSNEIMTRLNKQFEKILEDPTWAPVMIMSKAHLSKTYLGNGRIAVKMIAPVYSNRDPETNLIFLIAHFELRYDQPSPTNFQQVWSIAPGVSGPERTALEKLVASLNESVFTR